MSPPLATPSDLEAISRAADAIMRADALLITAGAGMGVDSGLPDFRGNEGFWNAYPPYRSLGLAFDELANPRWFRTDPGLAWGFYGHRLHLYRRTQPHAGFALLRQWAARKAHGAFVFTSNVDGQFQRAGFDDQRVVECHGALDYLQCTNPRGCGRGLLRADGVEVTVDETTFRATPPLPTCACGELLRPAVLMFGDYSWNDSRTEAQTRRLRAWRRQVRDAGATLVIVECGAGTAIPTVRGFGEDLALRHGAALIRINVREPEVPKGHLGLSMGALAGLRAIDQAMGPKAASPG